MAAGAGACTHIVCYPILVILRRPLRLQGRRLFVPHVRATATWLFFAVACGAEPGPTTPPLLSGPQTTKIDCVAVMGALPTFPATPLAAVPYSGAPRHKRIGDLTDEELGSLCEFLVCLGSNGYGRACYHDGQQFQANVPDLLLGSLPIETCYPVALNDPTDMTLGSRESCMYIYRNQFAACDVGPWEDCFREYHAEPVGAFNRSLWAPDCATMGRECVN